MESSMSVNVEVEKLTDEEILLLNRRASIIDTIIVGVVFAVAAVVGGVFASNYLPPVSEAMRIAVSLNAQSFVSQNTNLGANISQDEVSGDLVATLNGEVIDTFSADYGSISLITNDKNNIVTYEIVFNNPTK